MSGELVPDSMKCAVLMRWAPVAIRTLVRQSTTDLMASYALFKQTVTDFHLRGQVFAGTGAAQGPAPMDIGAVGGNGSPPRWQGSGGRSWPQQQHAASSASKWPAWTQRQQQPNFAPAKGSSKGGWSSVGQSGKALGKQAWQQQQQPQQAQNQPGRMPSQPQQQPSRAGTPSSTTNTPFQGACHKCGRWGHKKSDCKMVMGMGDIESDSGFVSLPPSASVCGPSQSQSSKLEFAGIWQDLQAQIIGVVERGTSLYAVMGDRRGTIGAA
jgi:hypothetical protein